MEGRQPKVGEIIKLTRGNNVESVSSENYINLYMDEDDAKKSGYGGSYGWSLDSMIEYEFVDEPTLNKIIVHCPEKWMYEKLVELVGWYDGKQDYCHWKNYTDRTGIKITKNEIKEFGIFDNYIENEKFHFNDFMAKYFPDEEMPTLPEFKSNSEELQDKFTHPNGSKYHYKSEKVGVYLNGAICMKCHERTCKCPQRLPDGSWDFKFSEEPVEDWMKQEYGHPIKITGHEDIEETPIFKRDGVHFIKVPKDFYKPFNQQFFYGKSLADSTKKWGSIEINGDLAVSYSYPNKQNIINKIKNFMLNVLTPALKRALNKDMQAQYRAGLINGGMELTEEGEEELMEIVCQEKQAELTARAKEIIAEADVEEKKNK